VTRSSGPDDGPHRGASATGPNAACERGPASNGRTRTSSPPAGGADPFGSSTTPSPSSIVKNARP